MTAVSSDTNVTVVRKKKDTKNIAGTAIFHPQLGYGPEVLQNGGAMASAYLQSRDAGG